MGYTHYWQSNGPIDQAAWDDAVHLCRDVLADQHNRITVEPADFNSVAFNGLPGEEYEDFRVSRTADGGVEWAFCKTAMKPYDVVVVACLTILQGIGLGVDTDGSPADCEEGCQLAQRVTGHVYENIAGN